MLACTKFGISDATLPPIESSIENVIFLWLSHNGQRPGCHRVNQFLAKSNT